MLAVVPVRDGVLPAGAMETAAECAHRTIVIGSGATQVASLIGGTVRICEAGDFRPAAWAAVLAPLLVDEAVVVLPASPDGRDLAPRLAAALDRPLFSGAIAVSADTVTVTLGGGTRMRRIATPPSCVATFQVGVRGVEPPPELLDISHVELPLSDAAWSSDAEVLAIVPPDAATIDLAEAPLIVGGGAGLHGPEQFGELAEVANHLGASVGATRVVTDRGWVAHARQIGTTGVVVDPRLYLAFGISGAVQHTSGLGDPDHIISVNIDAYCPMMQLADVAIVADANAVLTELVALFGVAAHPAGAVSGTDHG
jgi:electron transfer flavoprotein alpha subunit